MHELFRHLVEEHSELKEMMRKVEESTERATKKREDLLMKIKSEIIPHMRGEEGSLYPVLLEEKELRSDAMEGEEEHKAAEMLLGQLEGVDPADEYWLPKFKVFMENVEHHIEEEEGHLFKEAEKAFSKDKLGEIMTTYEEVEESARSASMVM